jgi:hydrogenase nickel incorporation protein HypA/HybF
MHELSIAQAVLDIVEAHAAGRRVVRVELRVGHLRQVVPDALAFAFEVLTAGTVAQDAELVIEPVPATGRCRDCGTEAQLDGFPLLCPACGGWGLELLAGEELLVDALELEDGLATTMTDGRTNAWPLNR